MMTLREYLQLKNGTDVRGIATEGIAGEEVNLTPEAAEAIAEAFAEWLCGGRGKALCASRWVTIREFPPPRCPKAS